MKKILIKILLITFAFLAVPMLAYAANDLTFTSDVNVNLITNDTIIPTVITVDNGGVVTDLSVETDYIDITLDAGSDITFNTDGTVYFELTVQAGTAYTITPDCPTTTVRLQATGNAILRLEVSSALPVCAGQDGAGAILLPLYYIEEAGQAAAPGGEIFSDIAGHWAESYINQLYTDGYIKGYADGTFKPDQYIIRAEVAKLIAMWLNPDLTSADCDPEVFSDVSCSEWYSHYVTYLYLQGIVEGYTNGDFGPEMYITRAEALKMLIYAKMLQDTDISDVVNPFSDINPDDWFYDVVMIGYKLMIIESYEDGTFGPGKNITRAEFVKIFVETLLNN